MPLFVLCCVVGREFLLWVFCVRLCCVVLCCVVSREFLLWVFLCSVVGSFRFCFLCAVGGAGGRYGIFLITKLAYGLILVKIEYNG